MHAPTAVAVEVVQADHPEGPSAQHANVAGSARQPYQRPSVEPLGHWQVHTLETFSVPVLP